MTPAAPVANDLPPGVAEDVAAAALLLARRLHAGGTLWAAAPRWPHHAQHVAVEFVHPVVVGKPALPAVALPGHDAVAAARANVCAGDVVVAIGRADDGELQALAARAPAWGAAVVWVGAGPRPAPGVADAVLWVDDGDTTAAFDGRFILVYHLLWELAHVCLEHAGVLEPTPAYDGPVCVTCSDEGRLGEVVSVRGPIARVRTATGVEDVDLALVGAAAPHDLLVVHAGMAIGRGGPA